MKIKIWIAILVVLTVLFAMVHLNTREEVAENTLQLVMGDETIRIDISKLEFVQVSGVRVNGKGEEVSIEAPGILVKDVLEQENITEFQKVTVMADDSYQAEVTAEEVFADDKVYFLYEEESLRLIVFGDENSKRSVSNVVQITIE